MTAYKRTKQIRNDGSEEKPPEIDHSLEPRQFKGLNDEAPIAETRGRPFDSSLSLCRAFAECSAFQYSDAEAVQICISMICRHRGGECIPGVRSSHNFK